MLKNIVISENSSTSKFHKDGLYQKKKSHTIFGKRGGGKNECNIHIGKK